MTGKEYKICACDTPSLLASEVTELLSQGWELYGHPFVGAENGHQDSPDVESRPAICQAMVRGNVQPGAAPINNGRARYQPAPHGPLKPAPAIAPPKRQAKVVRPLRPVVAATARNIAVFLAVL